MKIAQKKERVFENNYYRKKTLKHYQVQNESELRQLCPQAQDLNLDLMINWKYLYEIIQQGQSQLVPIKLPPERLQSKELNSQQIFSGKKSEAKSSLETPTKVSPKRIRKKTNITINQYRQIFLKKKKIGRLIGAKWPKTSKKSLRFSKLSSDFKVVLDNGVNIELPQFNCYREAKEWVIDNLEKEFDSLKSIHFLSQPTNKYPILSL